MGFTKTFLISLALCAPLASGLKCYTNGVDKYTKREERGNFTFCVFIPESYSFFGITPNDDATNAYEAAFQFNKVYKPAYQLEYQVVTVCLLEKFTFAPKGLKTEYMFRCICNVDLCNDPANFTRVTVKKEN